MTKQTEKSLCCDDERCPVRGVKKAIRACLEDGLTVDEVMELVVVSILSVYPETKTFCELDNTLH